MITEVTHLMNLDPLKPKQTESRKDTFVALPTGYGKSIIFGVLPLLFDKMLGRFITVRIQLATGSVLTLHYCA